MPQPNIVIVHCHDLGQYLHCYGVSTVRTPRLDAFAASGVRFARSFCTAPQCSPSRASLFTGRHPHANGVLGLTHADFGWELHPDETHLAQMLKNAGYRTAAAGVIHETHSGPARLGYDAFDPNPWAETTASNAIARLEGFAADPSAPFFLSVGFLEPHRTPGPEDRDMGFLTDAFGPDDTLGVEVPGYLRDTPGTRAELAELQSAVGHADAQFGRVLDAVDRLGLADNTLIVFTTDHGVAMPRAKCSLYDPGIGVALIMRMPGRAGWHGGAVRTEMVSNIDFVPTVLDLLGLPVPANLHGRSLAPLLDGDSYIPRGHLFAELTYHDYYDPKRCVRTENRKLIVNFTAAPFLMDPSQSWRPRSDPASPPNNALAYHPLVELYDLDNDPWELDNRADNPAYATDRAALLALLRAHMRDTGDPLLDGAVTPPMHTRALRLLDGADA
jgi:N-sulfoglucosamine sulfohydrolase